MNILHISCMWYQIRWWSSCNRTFSYCCCNATFCSVCWTTRTYRIVHGLQEHADVKFQLEPMTWNYILYFTPVIAYLTHEMMCRNKLTMLSATLQGWATALNNTYPENLHKLVYLFFLVFTMPDVLQITQSSMFATICISSLVMEGILSSLDVRIRLLWYFWVCFGAQPRGRQ